MKSSHPRGLYILFFTELWERFSFYGMRALLVLYLTKALLLSDDKAYGVYGAYGALVYTTPVIGGLLADRLLGYQRAIVLGATLMALGHFCLAVPHSLSFYGGLGLLIAGNGLFKPNISSLVGRLYAQNDPRRDAGFTIFYMGINLGAFLAPLACGFVGQNYGWHYGFGLAGLGMLIGLSIFLLGRHRFAELGLPPLPQRLQKSLPVVLNVRNGIYAGLVVSVPILGVLVLHNRLTGWMLIVVGVAALGWVLYIAFSSKRAERNQLMVILILALFSIAFWSFFEQGGSSINLFTDRNIDREILGWDIPASLFQAVNPMFIMLMAPLFSMLWPLMARNGTEPSTPAKFAFGILLLAAGFAIFGLAAGYAGDDGKISLVWLLLGYALITSGELCLSPVGLSMVTRLAPAHLVGVMMGIWFLSTACAQYIAGLIAKLTSAPAASVATRTLRASATIGLYGDVFMQIAVFAAVVGCALLLMSPWLYRLMHQKDDHR